MNLAPFYPWIVFIHVIAAFLFVLSHGVSMFVAERARREQSTERVAALLDLSKYALPTMYGSLLVLFVAGLLAGIVGGHFGRLWIWVAIAILVVELFAMYILATRYFGQLRAAAGLPSGPPARQTITSPDDVALRRLLDSRQPDLIAAVGAIGLIAIIWLMVVKPF